MLQARWKGGVSSGAAKPEAIGAGQIRSFRIGRMEPDARKIELELGVDEPPTLSCAGRRGRFFRGAGPSTAATASAGLRTLPFFSSPMPICNRSSMLRGGRSDQCFKKARTLKNDFVLQGGDHVFDALQVNRSRATSVFDLYAKTEQDLGTEIYHTIGVDDCFGIYVSSGVAESDALYGKKMFEERFGKTYYSFDHKGVHFVVLGCYRDHQ